MAGQDTRRISCVIDRQTDEHGNYQGETLYPVVGEIQTHPAVSALLKQVECRLAVTVDQTTGLLYRKLPSANGFANSWLTSAEVAIQSWVGSWGRVTSDRNAGVYRFEGLNLHSRPQPSFPDIDGLIDELLADWVIDRLDHPVLERLLTPTAPSMATTDAPGSPAQIDEEDADDIY
jgi:hypothetical protein